MVNDKLFSYWCRIYKNIADSVKQKGPAFQKVFEFCYKYKLKCCQEGKGTISQKDKKELKDIMLLFIKDILGLKNKKNQKSNDFDKIMSTMITIRNHSRENKNWDVSDLIREEISNMIYCLTFHWSLELINYLGPIDI